MLVSCTRTTVKFYGVSVRNLRQPVLGLIPAALCNHMYDMLRYSMVSVATLSHASWELHLLQKPSILELKVYLRT